MKMKKTTLCILLVAALVVLGACSNKESTAEAPSDAAVTDSTETTADSTETAEDVADTSIGKTQTVGNDKVGYSDVPTDWLPFEDVEGASAFQYASADSKVILSMDVVDESTLGEEEKESITAESVATGIWGTFEAGGVKQLTGSKVKMDGYDAFQVYGAYTDGQNSNASSIIVCWVFESDDGVIHVVSVEGAADSIMDAVTQVEASYRVTAK